MAVTTRNNIFKISHQILYGENMFDILSACLGPLGAILFVAAFASLKQIMEYERGVLFTMGRFSRVLGPGWHIIIPVFQSLRIVDTRITTVDIPKQEVMTKDNVPVNVNAVVYMRVDDPEKAVLKIRDYIYAVAQYGQTALRDIIGERELDNVLTDREGIAKQIKEMVDAETEAWGVDIASIKVQDIELPANMKRAMARQAEAEREKRGAIIKSEGEVVAAKNLAKAAELLASSEGGLHLRTLQTLSDISSDQSTKYIFTVPLEILKAFGVKANDLSKEAKTSKKKA